MALSPQQIQEARTRLGISVPDTNPTPAGTFSEKLAKAREASKPKLGEGAAGEFAGNVVRAVAAPLVRTGAAIESGLDQTLGRGINAMQGKGFTPTTSGQEAFDRADAIEEGASDTLAGSLGTGVGTIAPYLTGPGGAKLVAEGANLATRVASGVASKLPTVAKDIAVGTAQTDDLGQGVATGLGGQAIGALAKPISAAGKGIYKALAIPMSKAEARIVQAYNAKTPFLKRVGAVLSGESKGPITADETAFSKGLFGTESMIGTQAKRVSDTLWKDGIKPALDRAEVKVNIPKFFEEAEKKIVQNTPELSRQKDLLEALKALRDDYEGISEVSLAKLQDFKKGWAKNVPQKAYQGKDIAGAFADVKNIVAGQARKDIYEVLGPEMKQAYIDYGNLQSLAEWGQNAMTGAKFKGGTGGLLNAMKDAVLTPIATIGGHVLYKTGEGAEFLGSAGARYLSDLFNEESQN